LPEPVAAVGTPGLRSWRGKHGAEKRGFSISQPRLILTVGHSNHPLEVFLELLGGAGVEQVVDVRRFPSSRRHPRYGGAALAEALREREIAYEHVGALGGRRPVQPGSRNDGWQVAGFRGYADHLRSAEFAEGMGRLEELAAQRRVAVMCAEAQWWRCHRRLLADVLVLRGWEVRHLMTGGRLIAHQAPGFMVAAEDGLPCYPAAGQDSLLGSG
jgi:uncharacterized protein (DUF488 family)